MLTLFPTQGGNVLMKRWKTPIARVCLFFLATVPAYCQRGTLGVDVGQTSDKFGGLARNKGEEANLQGEMIVLQSSDTEHGADVVAGGELRFPVDTALHAREYALYGGVAFRFNKSLSAGFHIQVHRIYLPPSTVAGQIFNRSRLSLLEVPGFVEYKFGPAKHAFVRGEGGMEFSPRYKAAAGSVLPNPNLDHGYFVRGSVGYNFGKWYVKGNYETRYFKFRQGLGNPSGLYNWRSDMITGGVGVVF
jgi:hypothetical protein